MKKKKKLKGYWFDKKGKPVIKDGISLRDIEENEILFSYGKGYIEVKYD